jgi:2-polyprenyl-6-hydroxyphenyl methylase/3-demethylubiquinone-9 3-methyltransferase
MIATHEAIVASRFDALHGRFKRDVAADDFRLSAIVECFAPIAGQRVLDLGCGKGRFSKALSDLGSHVVGLDLSSEMLAAAEGLARVRGTARRLPFGPASFDRVLAVEVFEHMALESIDQVCGEVRRVLRPGGTFAIVDKNAWSWNAQRPWLPGVAVKWIDERRGLWMYSHREQVRERWFSPYWMARQLARCFTEVRVVYPLARAEEGHFPFQFVPGTRLFVLWAARAPGGQA